MSDINQIARDAAAAFKSTFTGLGIAKIVWVNLKAKKGSEP